MSNATMLPRYRREGYYGKQTEEKFKVRKMPERKVKAMFETSSSISEVGAISTAIGSMSPATEQ
jgi:hypothetical protein